MSTVAWSDKVTARWLNQGWYRKLQSVGVCKSGVRYYCANIRVCWFCYSPEGATCVKLRAPSHQCRPGEGRYLLT
jgi:hypothetical protein